MKLPTANLGNCTICDSNQLQIAFEFPVSITSFSTPVAEATQVLICSDCGHVFNANRQLPEGFYENEYDLLLEGEESEFWVFSDKSQNSLFDSVISFIHPWIQEPKLNCPDVLEVGAGKGMLLKKIIEKTNVNNVFAVEPNSKSEINLRANLKGHNISMTTLDDSPFASKKFDLIFSHGVLEHVANPLAFLKSIRNCMDDHSLLYIGVPNFEANPADLLTIDHLSKFNESTINYLFSKAGLKVKQSKVNSNEVFMMFLLEKAQDSQANGNIFFESVVQNSQRLVETSKKYIDCYINGFKEALEVSNKRNQPLCIYGAGNIGLVAMNYYNIDTKTITCIYDDNNTFWGTSRMGIPIRDPKNIVNGPKGVIYISSNACYHTCISQKAQALGVEQEFIFPKAS
jgi:SAM-dependent methyltransferase